MGSSQPASEVHRFSPLDSVHQEEGDIAGRTSGTMFLLGGATLLLFIFFPGAHRRHLDVVLVIALLTMAWGVCAILLVDWREARPWIMHTEITGAVTVIAIGVSATGGVDSLCWIYLFFVVVFAANFYRREVAAAYIGGCILVHAIPLAYDPAARHERFIFELIITGAAFASLGAAIAAGKMLTLRLRERSEELAAEQSALRRIATAVVDGRPPEAVYELVSSEVAGLLGAAGAGVMRILDEASVLVVGSWATTEEGRYPAGRIVTVAPGSDVDAAIRGGRPVRINDHPKDSPVDRMGYASSIVAPIRVANRVWGALAVATHGADALTDRDERRMEQVVELLATSIAWIEDRAKLAAQASSDPLTGLANHRTVHERLRTEVARTQRSGDPLSVAVLDIDNFKQLNDIGGHDAGDRLLVRVSECLQGLARAGDTLGRVGGDEFAWILPGTSRESALVAVERARRRLSSEAAGTYPMTISAGICDTTTTQDPAELVRLADGALYWSKAHGRDQCWVYDPEVVEELSAEDRVQRLARSQALLGLRALARAIDAKDPATRQHSERVAQLVGRLARVAGWSAEQALLLGEAALVHDVGKIGVPDATLRKMTPLTEAERAQIRGHAELSAQITEGVLAAEQVDWIRTHHERPDGTGYPRGLSEHEIPEGAR